MPTKNPGLRSPADLGANLHSKNESRDSEFRIVLTFGEEGKEELGKGPERGFGRVRFGFLTWLVVTRCILFVMIYPSVHLGYVIFSVRVLYFNKKNF